VRQSELCQVDKRHEVDVDHLFNHFYAVREHWTYRHDAVIDVEHIQLAELGDSLLDNFAISPCQYVV
jgi:hypothetical protein